MYIVKCLACDCLLSDWESVRKDKHDVYVDLCSKCYQYTKDDALNLETELYLAIDKDNYD
ncbi:hypothetical protein UFOVP22_36 [uncultured Caudovirales phage]|uniref:Uncharacterized protein n=1 Tax=uncultured Caudovirales phage TaxID=2100421 RepID=A0A6J5T8I1_9CAUD|nr:hypothetical protein UFOVP22_36 [uncultured Caudovirales phage]